MSLKDIFKYALTEDIYFEISRGVIPGFTPLTLTGNNGSVGASLETIWDEGGLYVYPPEPLQFKVSSANVNDTILGTGAREVFIAGLDSEGLWQVEIVKLNGQTAVLTTKTFSKINCARITSVGSNGRNHGKVYIGTGTITTGVPATKYGLIDGTSNTQDNAMKQGVFTVPRGYKVYITGYVTGVEAAKEGTLSVYYQVPGRPMIGSVELILFQAPLQITLRSLPSFPELTNIEIRGFADTGDLFIRANIGFILERVDPLVPFILPESLIPSDTWEF